jgi:decaprenylphospho-beta-D-ribofuranose 2-oxidase
MISGWGNYPRKDGDVQLLQSPLDIGRALGDGPAIAHGAGRAYGDAAIGTERTVVTVKLDRMLSLDTANNELTTEAGATLSDVIHTILPRGYFPAVVPGTQFVTIGGMVASNVHGKNHHRSGGFGRHVTRLKLVGADGRAITCGPAENGELFRATVGGMGLTGLITEVTFKVIPVETGYFRQETVVASNLDAAMRVFEESQGWTYTVAWIDGLARGASLGRSLIYRGEHARFGELDERKAANPFVARAPMPLAVPFFLPDFTLNRLTVKAFNAAYHFAGARQEGIHLAGWYPFCFPLDAIADWNRIYGRRGFIQHQCVIPKAASREAIGEILEVIQRMGNPSFLAVLKLLGPDDDGLLSFPMEGYTLAIDFPVSERTMAMAQQIDRVVAAHGGRLYLAKDARQDRAMLDRGYPKAGQFRDLRRQSGAAAKFRSLQSERLGL